MTIQRTFFDWGRSGINWDAAPYESCSPNLLTLYAHLMNVWGGENKGCHHDRPIVGGSSVSTHSYGAAFDWGYGSNRIKTTLVVIPWLIANSAELGIDAIHDYVGDRIWRAGRTISTGDAYTSWWRTQNGSGGQMGASWATWLHIETTKDSFSNTAPIPQRLTPPPPPPGDDDMDPLPNGPERAYDSRPEFQGGVHPILAWANGQVPKTRLEPGKPRLIVVSDKQFTKAEVNVTVVGHGNGFAEVSPTSLTPQSSLVNFDLTDRVESNTGSVATPSGLVWLHAVGAACDIAIDVRARG